MRLMFSLTGLLILLGAVYAVGGVGMGTLAHAGAAISDAVAGIAPTAPQTQPAPQPKARAANISITGASGSAPSGTPDVGRFLESRSKPAAAEAPARESRPVLSSDGEQMKADLKDSLRNVEYRSLPDGVSQIRRNADGSFRSLLCKGTSVVPASLGLRGERTALSRSGLRAKASLAQYMCEHISAKTTDNSRVEFEVKGDSSGETHEGSSERVSTADTIVLTSEAVLRGAVTLHQEVASENGGRVAIVVLGISERTLSAAMELQGSSTQPGNTPENVKPTVAPAATAEDRVWGSRREDLDEMGF